MNRAGYFPFGILLIIGLVWTGLSHVEPSYADDITFSRGLVSIDTSTGTKFFEVEIATTSQQRGRGLMDREFLARDEGMLFLYDSEQMVSMWMKNTLIPLDMLFMDSYGIIRHIARETEPLSLDIISSRVPVMAVLEIPGGVAKDLGIAVGDKVAYERISQ